MLRRILDDAPPGFMEDWVEAERRVRDNTTKEACRAWRRHKDKPAEWWRETFGILPEEMSRIK